MRRTPLYAAFAVILAAQPALAQECNGEFSAWLRGVIDEAAAKGVGPAGQQALANARLNEEVLRHDRAQGVFTQNFLEFSSRMVNEYRLRQGAANLLRHAAVFERARREYGVPGEVIAAFWALETDFGAVQGDFVTLHALATLAHDCRRPEIFRPQLIALAHLIDRGTLSPEVTGAWAGEIGQMQLLPSDYLKLGVDGDGDGRVDLKGSAPDAILTTARSLQNVGWRAGEPWLEEIRVPAEMPWELTGLETRLPRAQWSAHGITYRDGRPLPADNLNARVLLPMGRKGPAFIAYDNYDVYLEWNQSFIYTVTAAYLATRLGGAPKLDPRNPEPGLDVAQMKALQEKLSRQYGHDVGRIDGILGAGTRAAVRAEQLRLGLPADSWPTRELPGRL